MDLMDTQIQQNDMITFIRTFSPTERYMYKIQDTAIFAGFNSCLYTDFNHFLHSVRLMREFHKKMQCDETMMSLMNDKKIIYPQFAYYIHISIVCIKNNKSKTIVISPYKNDCVHNNNSKYENIKYTIEIRDNSYAIEKIFTEKNYDDVINIISQMNSSIET